MNDKILRSPFFYVGDKHKLINEIRKFFPQKIDTFVEPFVGGGSVFMNVQANSYCLNDIDSYVIRLHRHLCKCANNQNKLFDESVIFLQPLFAKGQNLRASFVNAPT